MKVATFLVLGSAAVSQLVAAHSGSATAALRKHRRDLLKSLYARQDYGGGFTQPTCQTDSIDTRNADGTCNCGPGRQQSGPNNCVTSTAAASNYNPVPAPQTPSFSVSNSKRYTGPSDFMDTNQCAAIASALPTSRGFYIQPSVIDSGNNDCWVLGDQDSDSPPFQASPFDNMPFVSNGGTGSTKRAVPGATTGTVGNGTGTIGYAAAAPGSGSCDTGLGDTVNGDGTCTCGSGRVNDTPQTCVTSASAQARLRRRAIDQNASW